MKKMKYEEKLVSRLIELKLKLAAAKPLYAQYDEVLQKFLNLKTIPALVSYRDDLWSLRLVDGFSDSNTQWKSVAHRRYDISIGRMAKLSKKGFKK